ncbi:MAG: NTP transferase domain-containing protein [Phycisphaerales bacterium]|nr:NTP transferase domain-containing protein [Phycisphaerales bacterium]
MPPCRGDHVVVLAAGRGTRMGMPKALMVVDGQPWWQRQKRRLDEVGVRQTWVVSEAVRMAMQRHRGVPEVVISSPVKPMFESMMVGLMRAAADPPRGVFVLPVDVPVPHVDVFRALAGAAQPALPVCHGVHGHPVYLPWHWLCERVLGPEFGGRALPLFGGERRLDHLLRSGRVLVDVYDPTISVNLNTPEDVQKWLCPGLAAD